MKMRGLIFVMVAVCNENKLDKENYAKIVSNKIKEIVSKQDSLIIKIIPSNKFKFAVLQGTLDFELE